MTLVQAAATYDTTDSEERPFLFICIWQLAKNTNSGKYTVGYSYKNKNKTLLGFLYKIKMIFLYNKWEELKHLTTKCFTT